MQAEWLRLAKKELRTVRTFADAGRLGQKLIFLAHRERGDFLNNWPTPPMIQIEPTNRCNLDCICCGGRRNSRSKGNMDMSLFRKIVDEGASLKTQRIHLYMHGEPLLHPYIVDMVRYVKSKHIPLTLISNGMLLDRKTCSALLESGLDNSDYLVISLLGYSKRVHEQIMVGVDHERVEKNIVDLLEARRQKGMGAPLIETVFYALPENLGEEKEYRDYWSRLVDYARVSRASEQYVDRPGDGTTFKRTEPCRIFSERISVLWNGDVPLCHADINCQYLLGNLERGNLRDIWNSEEHRTLRKIHRSAKFERIPLCAHCDW